VFTHDNIMIGPFLFAYDHALNSTINISRNLQKNWKKLATYVAHSSYIPIQSFVGPPIVSLL
jgi:hypothetical protein